MADAQGSKRRRPSQALGHDVVVFAIFSHRYVTYLLPALLKVGASRVVSHGRHKVDKAAVKNVVRFEVDMALVLSARGFAWSRALRQKLEQGIDVKKQKEIMPTAHLITAHDPSSNICKAKNHMLANIMLSNLWEVPVITRPLAPAGVQRGGKVIMWKKASSVCNLNSRRRQMARGGEDLGCCIRSLRRILPGGDEMGVGQLLSEVESYVICLQMQVSVLRSLLDARQQLQVS